MAAKPFASSADLGEKTETLEVLADGVYALTAQGDPNVGAIEGEDFLVAFEGRATPVAARDWLVQLREHTDKPVKYLVLSHYHAVRTLGASAFDAQVIVAHDNTRKLIEERGKEDWDSELGRMPRLFRKPESVPGLTWPDVTFNDRMTIDLGGDSGDAFHADWSTGTLDRVKAFGAEVLVGGRGAVPRSREAVDAAIVQTRSFLLVMRDKVGAVHARGGSLREAFEATHEALAPKFGAWPIFEHCLPFDVQRLWDELDGVDWPRIWTAERDREVWEELQG